ncbi:MAG: leucyl aminopeptidase [Gammaproteobacteria bacterium RIFCSPHIGHO2_12_FULL_35_23]|nr:MAG: leucyl aminopeptidase [Gammaproteobacteria bacterium RIFCSPHIGHO2_12_FULL_35_23]
MLICFQSKATDKALPIILVEEKNYSEWLADQPLQVQAWLDSISFVFKAGNYCLLTNNEGRFSGVLLILDNDQDVWLLGSLPLKIPEGIYYLDTKLNALNLQQAIIAWGLGAYQFTRYKNPARVSAQLTIPNECHFSLIENIIESTYLVRDLINTPAEDMGPLELAEVAVELGKEFHAGVTQIVAEDLLDEMYPAIFTVGRASYNSPRLIDIQWGDIKSPKLTLVGKGVCFDSGGLDIKLAEGMRLMKKDMGGAAHVLGLARMIMKADLPVRLRVLIPAVENSISGDAYRPGDIITMRNGKTVEITNTDAEGRLVLADALVEACSEKPDLLIDFATLTGAARIAVGTEIAAFFTNSDMLAKNIMAFAQQDNDPIWRMPLFKNYLQLLESKVANFTNSAPGSYAGAITAALFLEQFIDKDIPWLHFDIMAWNVCERPGHPEGGEAMGLRAVFDYLRQRFSSRH